jgi:hypothetical protein
LPVTDQGLSEGFGFRPWVVSKKLNDQRQATQVWSRSSLPPVCKARRINVDLLRDRLPIQPKVKPPLLQMVA